jgi:hypothetical protein
MAATAAVRVVGMAAVRVVVMEAVMAEVVTPLEAAGVRAAPTRTQKKEDLKCHVVEKQCRYQCQWQWQ